MHLAGRERLLRKRGDVVADENRPVAVGVDPRPMALDNGSLRLEDDEVRAEVGETALELGLGKLGGDAVEEEHLVSRLLDHRRGSGGNDGEDVGRMREPLELAVLREEGDSLLAPHRRICQCDLQLPDPLAFERTSPVTTCSRGRRYNGRRSTCVRRTDANCSPIRSWPADPGSRRSSW